ncbi:MAG: hypothetical protein BGO66_02990 [Alicycliphilus sp. 69-12]|nr:MAG: hypothetical protein BGO66_02990 [Alicycliphilus sp. 69-12]
MTERDTVAVVMPHGIEAMVCTEIAARQAKGVAKYGTTVAENPLTLLEWMRHEYEEQLDAVVYKRRQIAELEKIIAEGRWNRIANDLDDMVRAGLGGTE